MIQFIEFDGMAERRDAGEGAQLEAKTPHSH